MTTAVTTQMSFEERLREKLKTDIGALMTDEDLKKLVDKAMKDLFFSTRSVQERDPDRTWTTHTVQKPAVFVEVVKELMEPAVRKALADWMAAHPAEVKLAVESVLTTNFIVSMKNVIQGLMQEPFNQLVGAVNQSMQNHINSKHGGQY